MAQQTSRNSQNAHDPWSQLEDYRPRDGRDTGLDPDSGPVAALLNTGPWSALNQPTNSRDTTSTKADDEKAMPIPKWLLRFFYLLPIVLYVPDAYFNFYVYTDGATPPGNTNLLLQGAFFVLWGFVALGLVGMAYLLSMLAPFHWGGGHKIQAIFCGIGLLVAMSITLWNSLAYRSQNFVRFKTDDWIASIISGFQHSQLSMTMIIVACAPPFWGLFWAIVQPTRRRVNVTELNQGHEMRLIRQRQQAEFKAARAEANALVREAQLKGMARTARAARDQAGTVFGSKKQAAASATANALDTTIPTATPATVDLGPEGYQEFSQDFSRTASDSMPRQRAQRLSTQPELAAVGTSARSNGAHSSGSDRGAQSATFFPTPEPGAASAVRLTKRNGSKSAVGLVTPRQPGVYNNRDE